MEALPRLFILRTWKDYQLGLSPAILDGLHTYSEPVLARWSSATYESYHNVKLLCGLVRQAICLQEKATHVSTATSSELFWERPYK